MLIILAMVVVFHLLVLAQVLPYTIVWGGRFESAAQMQRFEVISVVINLFMIFIVLLKGQYINLAVRVKWINGILWGMVLLFALNTIGNLLSASTMETILFTPVTFLSALLCLRIVTHHLKPTT